MTPTGPIDRDDQLAELLRLIGSDRARLDDPGVRRAIEQFYGRPDALELLREVAREERLVRLLQLRTGIGSDAAGNVRREPEPRALSIGSIGARSHPSIRAVRWRVAGFAAAAALLIGFALNSDAVSALLRTFRDGGSALSRTVTTQVAQLDTVNLPDGSRAILAPNSRLEYAVSPRTGPREIRLDGEALFDVKHDEDRPFRVRTRRAVVEDLGTSFVVREYAADSRARVAVRSGAAALRAIDDANSSPIDLRPGDGAYIDSIGTIARFIGDPESFGAWTAGYLTFDGATLPEVLSQLETWYDVEFRMTDSTLTKQHFTGGLSSTSLSKALEILGPIVHAHFAQEGREVLVTTRPPGR
jgi:ferric-dicitrate binding protein FerR (iron transport regulator)